jgi:hypothetical protein
MFYIYRNLHRGLAFSVRENGRVIDRLTDFVAYDVRFKVSEHGRARVIREGRKNVHAFVVVQRYSVGLIDVSDLMPVKYNPYTAGTFMCGDRPINTASAVAFSGGRCYLMI